MDVNDVSTISNSVNLNNIPSQYTEKSKYTNSVEDIETKDPLKLTITEIYNKQRDELSHSLQNLNEGIAISQISLKALESQQENLKNIEKALIQLEVTGDYEENRVDTANEISNQLNEYNQTADTTTFQKKYLLNDQYADEVLNIVTNKENYQIKGINTKDISKELFESLQSNTLSSDKEIDDAISNVNKAIDKNILFTNSYEDLQGSMKQNARGTLNEQLNLLKENSNLKDSNFGSNISDFSKSNISVNLGHLAASQAHIIQEQSSKLLV